MTNDELRLNAITAFKSLPNGFEVIGAKVVPVNGTDQDEAGYQRSLVWLNFLDSTQQPQELIFKLDVDEPQWVENEILRRLQSSSTSIENKITVGSVSGLLVGTNTGVINRNYFGGDTYNHVQFFVLSATGRLSGMKSLIREIPDPYKSLSPYGAQDSLIFKGREDQIRQLDLYIHEHRIVVLNGEASVGKTSLLAAGVIPRLLDEGLMAIKIQEYTNPVAVITQALKSQQEDLRIPLPETLTLRNLMHAITSAIDGTLVLVLDQFELLFESSISSEQRDRFIDELTICLREIPSQLLRLVIAIRAEAKTQLWELQDRLPELLRCQVQLLPLDRTNAVHAIREPLRVVESRVAFYDDVVERLLVPGLAEIGSSDPNLVHPPYLQIVCSWLYSKSTEYDPPRVIDEKMVNLAKGAEGIFASYLEETLKAIEDERRLSSRMLEMMARPEMDKWITPAELHEMNTALSLIDIEQSMVNLVRGGLLVRRAVDGKYAFVSPMITREIVRLAGPEIERRSRAENEVERVWLSWLARNAFASGEQLRYLEKFGTDLTPREIKTMLLLRSAVERHEPPRPWLVLLNGKEGRALMFQLEGLPLLTDMAISSEMVLSKAEVLLELPAETNGDSATEQYRSAGRVARNAVTHADAAVRQTCALALTAISDDKGAGLERLAAALSAGGNRLKRRAELRGALADADEAIEKLNRDLSPLDRAAIWAWRAFRRIAQDRRRWLVLVLGGALGAGVGLGVLRVVIAAFAFGEQPGIQFSMFFYYGFIFGGSLALGMSLAKPLLLRKQVQQRSDEVSADPSLSTLTTSLAVVLGTAFAGLAQILLLVFNGLSPLENPLVVPMGFVGGLGLSSSISIFFRMRSRVAAWLFMSISALTSWALTQIPFNISAAPADALSIVNTGWYYESRFQNYSWWPELAARYSNLFDLIATFDSALAGMFLALGMSIGLTWARKYLNRRPRPRISVLE